MKKSSNNTAVRTLAAGLAIFCARSASAQVKVACVGDSITAGYALADPAVESYPAQLQALLGSGYTVGNFGLSGSTLQKQGDFTYWNTWQHNQSQGMNPDIVVIMLGTNDSKSWNWNATRYDTDYRALIAQYQALASHPKVCICLPPPIYEPNPFGGAFSPARMQNEVLPSIRGVAATTAGVTLIDNNTPLLDRPDLFSDGVHPTPQGAGIIAGKVAAALTATSNDRWIYTDRFHDNWGDSWSYTLRFPATDMPHSGANSMAIAPGGQWQAWWLKTWTNVSTIPFAELSFWAHGGSTSGQTIGILGELGGSSSGLPTVWITVPANQWQQVTVPLSTLGIANADNLTGFRIGNGFTTGTRFIDDMRLTANPGLQARYALDGDAQDSGGKAFHGTGSAMAYQTGVVGAQAGQFNGSSTYVSIPRSVTDDFTVTMWIKTTDNAAWPGAQWWNGKGLVDGEVAGGGADWGTALVDGKFVLGVGSSSGDVTLASSVNINDGLWHHLAATRSNATGAMEVYVDGVLRGSGAGPAGARTFPPALRIGGRQTGGNFLAGSLDDVRLYDRILGANEIAAFSRAPAAP